MNSKLHKIIKAGSRMQDKTEEHACEPTVDLVEPENPYGISFTHL